MSLCKAKIKNDSRKSRHARVRKKMSGSEDRPRLVVYRSLKHIYAQVVDDSRGVTLAAASTLDKELASGPAKKTDVARKVGRLVAERSLERGIKEVVFDRGGYIYHGRVKSLACGAREAGLSF